VISNLTSYNTSSTSKYTKSTFTLKENFLRLIISHQFNEYNYVTFICVIPSNDTKTNCSVPRLSDKLNNSAIKWLSSIHFNIQHGWDHEC
jgi:hypothetical protein